MCIRKDMQKKFGKLWLNESYNDLQLSVGLITYTTSIKHKPTES